MKQREFEYVLIGSGVAASTVAKTILESNRLASILILDAGPKVPAKDRRSWWDYVVLDRRPYDYCYDKKGENQSVGKTPWSFDDGRVMMYGGSTVHWGGWCLRFKPEDFEVFSRTGEAADWPISYDTLEPYYCRAEEYLSVCGDDCERWTERSKPYPLPPFPWTAADSEMIAAFQALGIKPGKLPIARYRKCMTTGTCKYCPFGARFSGQIALDDLLSDGRHTNLEVLHDAPAAKIHAESKRRIESVEYLDSRTGERYAAHAKTIVVCAGAYETPKLLQMSTSAYWKDGIGNDHDIVGRYISSHPYLIVRGRRDDNEDEWFQEFDFPTLMSRTYDSPEMQQGGGKIFLFKDRTQPNVDIAAQMIQGMPREEVDRVVRSTRTQELQAFMDDRGHFENRVSVGRGQNRFGLPQTQIDFSRRPEFYPLIERRLALMEKVIVEMGYTVDPNNRKIRTQSAHLEQPEIDVMTGQRPDLWKAGGFSTIGEFYDAIATAFRELAPALTLTGQVIGPRTGWAISTLAHVERAINTIKEQGEGSSGVSPVDLDPSDWSHYYRFAEIQKGREIVQVPGTMDKWMYGDQALPFPDVWPVIKLPKGGYDRDRVTGAVSHLMDAFDKAYTALIDELQATWSSGDQAALWRAVEAMFGMQEHALALMKKDAKGNWITGGTYKIVDLYPPQYQETFSRHESPPGLGYFDAPKMVSKG